MFWLHLLLIIEKEILLICQQCVGVGSSFAQITNYGTLYSIDISNTTLGWSHKFGDIAMQFVIGTRDIMTLLCLKLQSTLSLDFRIDYNAELHLKLVLLY